MPCNPEALRPLSPTRNAIWSFRSGLRSSDGFLDLGCLAQLTAASLTGLFGRRVADLSRTLVKKGYIHLLASDAHSSRGRKPLLSAAVTLLSRIIGPDKAQAMVTTIPAKIIRGEDII